LSLSEISAIGVIQGFPVDQMSLLVKFVSWINRSARGVLNRSIWALVSWDFGFILNKHLQEINIYFSRFLQLLPRIFIKYLLLFNVLDEVANAENALSVW
jgi:hypothetical protein